MQQNQSKNLKNKQDEIDALKAQLAEAERNFKALCQQTDQRESEVSDQFTLLDNARLAAEARAERLRAALEGVEWAGSFISCPWCHGTEENGHKPDCQRQAALDGGKEGGGE